VVQRLWWLTCRDTYTKINFCFSILNWRNKILVGVGVGNGYVVGSTVGSAVGSTVGSVVGCCAGSEVTVIQMRRYIIKNHFCFSILNSRNKIPVEVGVGLG
jgi:hypothetical protein